MKGQKGEKGEKGDNGCSFDLSTSFILVDKKDKNMTYTALMIECACNDAKKHNTSFSYELKKKMKEAHYKDITCHDIKEIQKCLKKYNESCPIYILIYKDKRKHKNKGNKFCHGDKSHVLFYVDDDNVNNVGKFIAIQGDPGVSGKDGLHGRDGRDGINGINGKDGKQGPRGPCGPPYCQKCNCNDCIRIKNLLSDYNKMLLKIF